MLSLAILGYVIVPIYASSGMTVSGALLVTNVSPGEILTHKITVNIGTTGIPTDIMVQVGGIKQAPDGTVQFISASADTSQYSASQFISVDNRSLYLEPGVPQDIIATIRIPKNVGEGGRYAIINVQTQSPNQGGVGVASAVNIPIYLTIKDSNIVEEGDIENISVGEVITGKPVNIITNFQNTGNHHFKVKGEVTVTDSKGDVLDTIYLALTPSSIVPMMVRQLKAALIPEGELPLGVYSIRSKVMLENGTILDEARSDFEVRAPYVPPPPPAVQTVLPNSSSFLETKDGRISINFPIGSVTEPVDIALRDYPLEQLPDMPVDFKTGVTCFRIDGLNGLLVKEARIRVGYTGADLEGANGNASRLKLAYWDESKNQWSVLKTTVDKTKMTLSTTTNHFSIWTVMIAPKQKLNLPLVVGEIIGGLVIVGSLTVFLTKRRHHH